MANATYVLKSRPYLPYDHFGDGYYTGESYVFQKERYAICDKDIEKAKHYKSFKVAQKSCVGAIKKFCNYVFDVVTIEDGKEVDKFEFEFIKEVLQ